mgnify:CR=1 FL=1
MVIYVVLQMHMILKKYLFTQIPMPHRDHYVRTRMAPKHRGIHVLLCWPNHARFIHSLISVILRVSIELFVSRRTKYIPSEKEDALNGIE